MSKLILEQETHRRLGACLEVYREKGCGFVEPLYQECLELELASQGIEFLAQQEIGLSYKGRPLRHDLSDRLGLFRQGHRRDQGGERLDQSRSAERNGNCIASAAWAMVMPTK